MSKEVFVFEVSEKSFNRSVILNSNRIPVLVEFMGIWSEHCIQMEDSLARMAKEFAGQFIFAKVDIEIIREMRVNLKTKHKIYSSKKIKKAIRNPDFKKMLVDSFVSASNF